MTKANNSKPVRSAPPVAQKPNPKAPNTRSKQSKSQIVRGLLSCPEGASLDDLCTATGWQPHSARAFLTGLKKMGYAIDSDKVDGVRRYRAIAPEVAKAA